MNDGPVGKRIVVVAAFFGLSTIAPSSAQLPNTGRIAGHVIDTVGATIAGASVFVRKHSPPEDNVRLIAHTDMYGNFVLQLPDGGYDVLVTSPGFAAGVETIPVTRAKTRKIQWRLKALGCDFPGMNCDTVR